MNFLRRVYLLLLGLLLIIAVTLLLLSPEAVGTWVGSISELSLVVRIAVTVVIDLILFALMYIQVRGDPRTKVNGLVMRGSGAVTEVSIESARERILKTVSDVPDVVSADATVKPVRGRADIELQVSVFGHDVKLPEKQKEINRALRQVIDKQLGLQMAGQPRIHLRIHGEETQKPPVVVSPPPAPVIEKPMPVQPPPPTVIESEPEPKRSGGLLGGWGRAPEPEEKDEDVIKPPLPASKPEPEASSPLTGLFGGLRRNHEDQRDQPPSPAKPVSEIRENDASALPPMKTESSKLATVDQPESPKGLSSVDEDDELELDLDDEFSHSDMDDVTDDETENEDTEESADADAPGDNRP
jgi:hypothetical protein